MEDLPLGRIAALVPEFSVKDLPSTEHMMMMMVVVMMMNYTLYNNVSMIIRATQKNNKRENHNVILKHMVGKLNMTLVA